MNDDQVDHSRRHLLTAATTGIGAVGVVFAAVPFIASWQPSERAKALGAPVSVDASKLEEGQMLKIAYRGQPVFVVRRSQGRGRGARESQRRSWPTRIRTTRCSRTTSRMPGPARARNPEYWVGFAVCTHLGCSPLGAFEPNNAFQVAGTDLGQNWPGGFYCPCHGSKYDISGRVFKSMPAPKNLPVPSYTFTGDALIVIGEDELPKSG